MFKIRKKSPERILFSADFVFLNGTHKKRFAILTENGKIIETGKREILKEQFPFTREIKLDGAIYPGFIDSHIHLNMLANTLSGINAENCLSVQELKETIKRKNLSEYRIYNFKFNHATPEEWAEMFEGIKEPVVIVSTDEHSVFVNKPFLEKHGLGIKETDGGTVLKVNGKFAGVLKDKAIQANLGEHLTSQATKKEIKEAIDFLLSNGITGITNFDYEIFDTLKRMEKNKELKMRIFQGIPCKYLEDAIQFGEKTGLGSNLLRIGPVKCFLDGSLGSQTALMNEETELNGMQVMGQKEFEETVKMANNAGLQVAVHAIGSKAVDIALNTYYKYGKPEARNRIEHMQFISENRLKLLEETDFIASMQPAHFKYDKPLLEKYNLNDYPHAYDWKFLLSMNKRVAFGSDAPVVSPNIAEGIYIAIFREDKKNISLKEAIKGYTENSAFANFYEKEGGRIIKNMNADFTVLNKPLIEDYDYKRIKTMLTILKGEVVWEK